MNTISDLAAICILIGLLYGWLAVGGWIVERKSGRR